MSTDQAPAEEVWSLAMRLASPDAATRDAALDQALALDEPGLAAVSAIDAQLTRWRREGALVERPSGLALTLYAAPDALADQLVARLPLVALSGGWTASHLAGTVSGLTSLPDEWLGGAIEALSFVQHRLTRLPARLIGLSRLRSLRVGWNAIQALPDDLGSLTHLEVLDLSCNQLEKLPASIGALGELRVLSLTGNRLRELPESLGDLGKLEELHVDRNQLARLPDSIGRLRSLRVLRAELNQLVELPASIGDLDRLDDLGLHLNLLERLPDAFGHLSRLTILTLQNNQLVELPATIGGLRALERLELHRNHLSTLPESVGELGVHGLMVPENPIRSLPRSLERMTGLNALAVDQSLLDADTRAWLRRQRFEVWETDPDDDM